MAVVAEELEPALEDARQAHTAVLDRLRADAAVTPPGPYRQMLEGQAAQVQVGLQRIQHRVDDLRPRGILGNAADVTRFVSHGAMRTVMLPLTIGTGIVRRVLPGGGPADARQLLRNAEDEYAAAARALAACRAGEVLAEQVDDEGTAELLGSLRRQDEELLQALEDSLAEQARAVVASANGSGPPENQQGGVADAAGRTMRTAVDRARHVARSGVRYARGGDSGETLRGVPEPGPMAEEVLGAVRREEDLPIPGFSQLSTEQIQRRLRSLSQLDLTVIEGYERAHARRRRVLDAIEQLRGAEPWTGYDAMNTGDVVASLQDAPTDQARQVLEHEQRHRRRPEVISAAKARVSG
ncbi:hypothetical protein [Streptomyces sp. NBC_01373]|uniref:hypothetical protein n=1 Tax=Streptomyces sp. NBC_01373 TaxID=2903843 RepID=UPI00224EFA75|nr:hypothetical protein [Streptomyces sp. NBC_01373]MCX4703740.1 hypothetical protein [Streptomyces sp. NBC_01373]